MKIANAEAEIEMRREPRFHSAAKLSAEVQMTSQRRQRAILKVENSALAHQIGLECLVATPEQAHANGRDSRSVLSLACSCQGAAVDIVFCRPAHQHYREHLGHVIDARSQQAAPGVAIILE